jgi:hypothetical protein
MRSSGWRSPLSFSGHTGIYRSQRIGQSKHRAVPEGVKLGELSAHDERQRNQALDVGLRTKNLSG